MGTVTWSHPPHRRRRTKRVEASQHEPHPQPPPVSESRSPERSPERSVSAPAAANWPPTVRSIPHSGSRSRPRCPRRRRAAWSRSRRARARGADAGQPALPGLGGRQPRPVVRAARRGGARPGASGDRAGLRNSRVPPELIFDQGLGDLYSVRIAGNILSATTLASISMPPNGSRRRS